jgi:hypothetical protein
MFVSSYVWTKKKLSAWIKKKRAGDLEKPARSGKA